jgi:hypothetical protein
MRERALFNARIQRPTDDPLPANVLPMSLSVPPPQQGIDDGCRPSAADLAGFSPKTRRFIATWMDTHVLNLQELTVFLSAARCRDNADRWHKRARSKGPQAARFARLALGYEKQFASLLGQLRVKP